MTHRPVLLLAFFACASAAMSIEASPPGVGPVPPKLRERLKLAPFYEKHLDVDGLPVLGSSRVSDDAMAEVGWIIRRMLGNRRDILTAMSDQEVRAVVMAADEYTTDVPEHADLRPKLFWDRRARGLGATPRVPVVSGGEENLLSFSHDPYPNENIFLHEFAHAIHEAGLNKVDPTFDPRLKAAHEAAIGRGLWKNTYAATDRQEYWAEGVQSWFDDNAPADALHNDVRTRGALLEYDPDLASLCREVFGDGPWRYVKPRDRSPEDRSHLADYDPINVPKFRWRSTEPGDHPKVVVQTAVGDFEVELDENRAPAAVRDFLLIALDGGYHSGRFVKTSGGGAWAVVNPRWKREWAKDLNLEPVVPTPGSKPVDGDVALIRDGGDRLGFVVFLGGAIAAGAAEVTPIGRIASGPEVVRRILDSPSRDGDLSPPIEVRRVIRSE